MADTTTTGRRDWCAATMRAAALIWVAPPTEVPPNFITNIGGRPLRILSARPAALPRPVAWLLLDAQDRRRSCTRQRRDRRGGRRGPPGRHGPGDDHQIQPAGPGSGRQTDQPA